MSDDDLFGSSDGDTDDLIAESTKKPVAKKKRLQKKSAASKKRKVPDADNDDDDDGRGLFDDSDDDKPSAPKKPLSKRERMDALQAKKRQETGISSAPKERKDRPDKNRGGTSGDGDKGYNSGDSYDSADFVRTEEDNDFIDVDDDDPDAINELYAEQHFDDERPDPDEMEDRGSSKLKKKSFSGGRRKGPDAVSGLGGAPDNPIMEAVNKMKRKKRTAKKATELEDEGKEFISMMENAADDDEQSVKARRPATRKLAMLSQVVDMLTRRDMTRVLLDLDVLATCKRWIQPLPSGSLGNVTVRQRIIEAVSNMGGENGITSNDLKRSGIGHTIMALYKHKLETQGMKRELKKLIEQWSRPIFKKSGNMKDLERVHLKRQEAGLVPAPVARSQPRFSPGSAGKRNEDLQSIIATGSKGAQKDGLSRVRVPFSKGFQFTVRPQKWTGDVADKRMVRPGAAKDNRGNLSKRMLEKGRAVAKNQRSSNISIEGRPVK